MRYSDLHDDPYFRAMKRYERSFWAYGVISVICLVASLFVGSVDASNSGMYAPMVLPLVRFVEGGLLIGSVLAVLVSCSHLARLIYFAKWPERFS